LAASPAINGDDVSGLVAASPALIGDELLGAGGFTGHDW
jgi:hypothetical protein